MHIFAWSPNIYVHKQHRRAMTTPVHRCQRIESVLLDHRGRGRCGRVRRFTRPRHLNENRDPDAASSNRQNFIRSSEVNRSTETTTTVSTENNDTNRNNQLSDPTHRNTLPNNFNRFRMSSVNWSIWGCFIIATMLLVPVHIYLKKYEIMGIIFVIILLFLICFSVSMYHTETRAILLHRLHLEEAIAACPSDNEEGGGRRRRMFSRIGSQSRLIPHLAVQPIRVSRSTPDLLVNGQVVLGDRIIPGHSPSHVSRSLSQVSHNSLFTGGPLSDRSDSSPMIDHNEDPPPYHEAIMLPAPSPTALNFPQRPCETPPPSYEILQ